MKKKEILLACICAVLLVVTSILGTVAYLTSEATVTNTFTVGKVNITLDETKVNEDGLPVDAFGNVVEKDETTGEYTGALKTEEGTGNDYLLIPGKNAIKDPTVTIKEKSEDSYVRMILTVQNASAVQAIIDNSKHGLDDFSSLLVGYNPTIWIYEGFELGTNNTISFEFRYHKICEGKNEAYRLEPLFTEVYVPATLTSEEVASLHNASDPEATFKMIVVAHAIQTFGFEADIENNKTAQDIAWEAFDYQHSGS